MTGQRIGYIRVSTFGQNPERQLENVDVDRIYSDKASGKDVHRPQLEALVDFVREGDTVVVHSMDRQPATSMIFAVSFKHLLSVASVSSSKKNNCLSQVRIHRWLNLRPVPNDLITYFTLTDQDRRVMPSRSSATNRLGFAIQLCALRFMGTTNIRA